MEEDTFRCTGLDPGGVWPEFLAVLQLVQVCPRDTIRISLPDPILVVLVYLTPPHRDAWLTVCGMFVMLIEFELREH